MYRIAVDSDIGRITELVTKYITEGFTMVEPIEDYIVCELDGLVVGLSGISNEVGLVPPYAHYNGVRCIGWTVVEPPYRGRGIATELIRQVLLTYKPEYLLAEAHACMCRDKANLNTALVNNGFKLISFELGYYLSAGGCVGCVHENNPMMCANCGVAFYEFNREKN